MNVIKTKSKSKFRISRYCSSYTVFFIQSVLPVVLSSCDEKVIATNANIRKKVSEYNAMENGDTLFNCLDTSKVSDMTDLFINLNTFNADISSWDISYVTTMHQMFMGAADFNIDISSWDTSNVKDMKNVFSGAYLFNGDVSDWDTSGVTDMQGSFSGAAVFNS